MTADNEIRASEHENIKGATVPGRRRTWRRWILPLAVLAVALLLQFLAPRNPKALSANPEEFYDHNLLKKIEGSGFSKQFAARR